MSILAWALVVAVVVAAGHRLYRSLRALRFLTSDASRFERSTLGAESTRGEGFLLVLLPCLNDQAQVASTLEHFSRLAREAPGRALVVPITGESEDELKRVRREDIPDIAESWWRGLTRATFLKLNGGRFPLSAFEDILKMRTFAKDSPRFRDELLRLYDAYPSTATLIDQWLEEHPEEARFIERLHEPARRGTRATKLNYAAAALEQKLPERWRADEATFFAVYDFDARPHPRSFEYLVERVRELKEAGSQLPTAFQQIPMPLGTELEQLRSTSPSLVAAAWRVEQALAMDAYSAYAVRAGERTGQKQFQAPRACRSSGLFLRVQALRELGGFPVDSDDIALGYRLDFLERPRLPHPYPVWVQPDPSTGHLVGRMRRRFHGVFSGHRELEWVQRHAPEAKPPFPRRRIALAYAQELLPILQLVCGGFAVTLLALAGRWFEAAGLLLGLWLLSVIVLWLQVGLATRLAERFDRRASRRWSLTTLLVGAPLGPLFTLGVLASFGWWKWRSGGQVSEETA